MRTLLLPFLLLSAGSASAQSFGTAEGEALRTFVEAVTVPTEGQLPRFHDPVCVVSEGLPRDFNHVVEERVRELARAAGIAVAGDRACRPNLIVLVANDGREVASVLRRRRPDIFAGVGSAAIDRLLLDGGPVRSWQSSVVRRAEGAAIAESRDSFLFQDVHLHHGVPAGLLRETTRRDLQLSAVIFDIDSINGLSLMQVADHAAMRGLAPTRPAEAASGRSILALFDGPEAREALPAVTRWDLAYLRALYRSGGAMDATTHRRLLARLAADSLSGARR